MPEPRMKLRNPRAPRASDSDPRAEQEREFTENRQISDVERRSEIRSLLQQSSLPNLPEHPGFHRCWVSTTHQDDTVQRRHRLGYRLVKIDDLHGWDPADYAVKDGHFQGCVMWREMIAMEVPMERYQDIMAEYHHHQPLESEAAIRNTYVDQPNAQLVGKGTRIIAEEGMESFGKHVKVPTFT